MLRKVALAIGGGTKADMVVVNSGIAKTMLVELDVAPMNAPPSFFVFEAIQLDELQFLDPSFMARLAGEQEPNEKKVSCPCTIHPWCCVCGCWITLAGSLVPFQTIKSNSSSCSFFKDYQNFKVYIYIYIFF